MVMVNTNYFKEMFYTTIEIYGNHKILLNKKLDWFFILIRE